MDNLYWLDQIQSADRPLVGEKAFTLAGLLQAGFPVQPGFVVPAQNFREFLESINWTEPLGFDLPHSSLHLDVDNPRQLQRVARQIRCEIKNAALPQSCVSTLEVGWNCVASAPSLECAPSLALHNGLLPPETSGLYESHICLREPEALASSVKQTWAEVFRSRSLFYWQRRGIEILQLSLAVLVQPAARAIASGTLELIPPGFAIQATWGASIALVKGEVIPDFFLIHPETGEVLSREIGTKTKAYRLSLEQAQAGTSKSVLQAYLLNDEQQKQYALEETYRCQLIELAMRLNRNLNKPFYLEWTLSKVEDSSAAQLYITSISMGDEGIKDGRLGIGRILPQHPSPLIPRAAPSFVSHEPASVAQASAGMFPPQRHHLEVALSEKLTAESAASPLVDSFATLNPVKHEVFSAQSLEATNLIKGVAAASGRVVAKAQVIRGVSHNWSSIPAGTIIVAKNVHPDWLVLLRHAAGVVAEQGGMTCHAAIIARELGIPAVVGAADATRLIQSGEDLMVDGDKGEVHIGDWGTGNPLWELGAMGNSETAIGIGGNGEWQVPTPDAQASTSKPYYPIPIATQLLVNLNQPNSIQRAANLPVDGVGLLRSELIVLEVLEDRTPLWWLQQGRKRELVQKLTEKIWQFARAFEPRPVFYRSLDMRDSLAAAALNEKFPSSASFGATEVDPMLGMRGTLSYIADPILFEIELAALAQVWERYTNVNLILPFVRTVEEFSFCRQKVELAGLTGHSQFQLWIMAEVPSVLFLLPQYVKAGVQGIAIGTNDLTQLLLGVSRDQAHMVAAFNERHPAVMSAIAQLIAGAKQAGIPCSICGVAPARYPEVIDALVRWGITSISVEVDAVERTYSAIARAEQRLILEAARRQLQN